MTLIELLIVIIILTTLVAAAIPLMTPSNSARRLREAARGLNAFISGAQMRAIATQRPVGVGFKKLGQDTGQPEDNGISLEAFYVEQPAPFTGFDETSTVRVSLDKDAAGKRGVRLQFVVRGSTSGDSLPHGWDDDVLPPHTFKPGDIIEVDGTHFEMIDTSTAVDGFYDDESGTPDGELFAVPTNDTGQLMNFHRADLSTDLDRRDLFWTDPLRYKIFRQPMPFGEPFQLPEGTAVDLRASGERILVDDDDIPPQSRRLHGDFGGFFHNPDAPMSNDRINNHDPVIVMFSPEGSIERVKFDQRFDPNDDDDIPREPFDEAVVSNIHFLVGVPENAPPPMGDDSLLKPTWYTDVPPPLTEKTVQQIAEEKAKLNWLSGDSQWIVIGARSGRVVSVENAFVDVREIAGSGEPPHVRRARQIDAAREFTREMTQVGGR